MKAFGGPRVAGIVHRVSRVMFVVDILSSTSSISSSVRAELADVQAGSGQIR